MSGVVRIGKTSLNMPGNVASGAARLLLVGRARAVVHVMPGRGLLQAQLRPRLEAARDAHRAGPTRRSARPPRSPRSGARRAPDWRAAGGPPAGRPPPRAGRRSRATWRRRARAAPRPGRPRARPRARAGPSRRRAGWRVPAVPYSSIAGRRYAWVACDASTEASAPCSWRSTSCQVSGSRAGYEALARAPLRQRGRGHGRDLPHRPEQRGQALQVVDAHVAERGQRVLVVPARPGGAGVAVVRACRVHPADLAVRHRPSTAAGTWGSGGRTAPRAGSARPPPPSRRARPRPPGRSASGFSQTTCRPGREQPLGQLGVGGGRGEHAPPARPRRPPAARPRSRPRADPGRSCASAARDRSERATTGPASAQPRPASRSSACR